MASDSASPWSREPGAGHTPSWAPSGVSPRSSDPQDVGIGSGNPGSGTAMAQGHEQVRGGWQHPQASGFGSDAPPGNVGGGVAAADGYEKYFADDDFDLDLDGHGTTRQLLEWAVVIVGAVLVALVLRAFLVQAFYIPSESMESTLLTRDRVLVNKLSYRLHDVNHGDVIVFHKPDDVPCDICDLIKRVVAVPGDTVEAQGNVVYINGQELQEPYLDPGTVTNDFPRQVVPPGHVFVMGDNRSESLDSREFGPVPQERVVGRAFVLFWPLNRIGWL